jgi:hypothetical protein
MIDKSIKSNDILKVVAVHDSLCGRKGFHHAHGSRPSARRQQQEQCHPNRGTSEMLSHGPSRTSVAGSIAGIRKVGYMALAHGHRRDLPTSRYLGERNHSRAPRYHRELAWQPASPGGRHPAAVSAYTIADANPAAHDRSPPIYIHAAMPLDRANAGPLTSALQITVARCRGSKQWIPSVPGSRRPGNRPACGRPSRSVPLPPYW